MLLRLQVWGVMPGFTSRVSRKPRWRPQQPVEKQDMAISFVPRV
jgi:hypothetical protein